VAVSLVLLIAASLFVRSFLKLQTSTGGLDSSRVLTMRFYMPAGRYEEDADMARRVEDVVRRVETVPGVEAVSASNNIPLGGGGGDGRVIVEGRDAAPDEEPFIFWSGVTPHFLEAVGLRPSSGRTFTEAEGFSRSGVALVNQLFAEKFWPKQDPINRRFRLKDQEDMGWIRVIGVVPNFSNYNVSNDLVASAYLPYPYQASRNTGLTIRTRAAPLQAVAGVRKEIRASDPNMPVFEIYTLEQVRQEGIWQFRFIGGMFTVFGFIALILAAVGVYGVLSYSVSQRVKEIGVRVALGAQNGHVVRLVLRQGMILAGLGIGLGLLFSFGATQALKSVLYDTSPVDPLSFSLISALLAGIAACASYLPARRAPEVDPLEALRGE
jgi:putative ABC transport system permease protein